MTGLSDASFMGGAMQGFSYGENMKANWKQQEQNTERLAMTKESHELKMNAARKKAQQEDLIIRARAGMESGLSPDESFWGAANGSGLEKLRDQNTRQKKIGTAKKIQSAIDKDEYGQDLHDSVTEMLADPIAGRNKDGFNREYLKLRNLPNGNIGLEVDVTNPEGVKYRAPLTWEGGTGKNEKVIQLDRKLMGEWAKVGMAQGEAAQLIEEAGNDPRKQWNAIHKVLTGKDYEQPSKAPGLSSVYDQNNGREQKVMWDGKKYIPIGGTKAPAPIKNGKGVGGSSGSSDSNKHFIKAVEKYQTEMASAINAGDPEAMSQIKRLFKDTNGFEFDDIAQAVAYKRGQLDDYSPLTYEEFSQFAKEKYKSGARSDVSQLVDTDESLFGSDRYSPKAELASHSPPQTRAPQKQVAQAPGLTHSAGFRGMPNLTLRQSQQVDAVSQSKEQAKGQLMAELQAIRSSQGRIGRRAPSRREANLLAAMREIDGSYDIETLNAALAKVKLGNESKEPGINDAAHMAAL